MSVSYVIRMPDLSKLDIPEKQRVIFVKDETIFRELQNEKRQVADREAGAVKGDYALIEVERSKGNVQTLHVELGGRQFPELEAVLLGSTAGQELHTSVCGEETIIRVRSVRKVIDFPLTDEAIASLNIPGIEALTDYRRKYLREHGAEIADRLFQAIQNRLLDNLLALAELSVDQGEADYYHQQQRAMVQNISGDVEQRLMDAYGQGGGITAEECDRLFFEDNKHTFSIYIWAKELAERNQVRPSEQERRQAIENYCMIFEKTEKQIREEGLMEDALRSFYFQYGIGQLRRYYRSIISFSAAGISPQPLSAEHLTQN